MMTLMDDLVYRVPVKLADNPEDPHVEPGYQEVYRANGIVVVAREDLAEVLGEVFHRAKKDAYDGVEEAEIEGEVTRRWSELKNTELPAIADEYTAIGETLKETQRELSRMRREEAARESWDEVYRRMSESPPRVVRMEGMTADDLEKRFEKGGVGFSSEVAKRVLEVVREMEQEAARRLTR